LAKEKEACPLQETNRYNFFETVTDILNFLFTDIWPVSEILLTTVVLHDDRFRKLVSKVRTKLQ